MNTDHKQLTPRRRFKLVLLALAVVLTTALVLICTPTFLLNVAARRYTYPLVHASDIPKQRLAIVFGAGIIKNSQPSPFLQDRLDVAIELYKQDVVTHILVSGDNRAEDYNEPSVMRAYLVEAGVAASDITLDYAGLDTYDSCYRAKHVFNITQAVLVTHGYHVPRALYACRSMGINATAVPVGWHQAYVRSAPEYISREIFATIKTVYDVEIERRPPRILGPPEEIRF